MDQIIMEALRKTEAGEPSLKQLQPVSGGDINQAFQAVTNERKYFIKLNKDIPAAFFKREAEGIELINKTNTVPVPEVYYFNEPKPEETGILIQEWIEGQKTDDTAYQFGINLGRMHMLPQEKHGFSEETFIGKLPQPNGLYDSWLTYYREKRLMPQFELADERNLLPASRRKKLEQLISQLDKWLSHPASPSLLHGDLWGGNWLVGKNGAAYLIDPSAFYGDRLMEIAFTEVFGGFPGEFYKGYEEAAPLPDWYPEVKPLYQLFYLLVHLNMFGEMYGSEVDRIVKKYV